MLDRKKLHITTLVNLWRVLLRVVNVHLGLGIVHLNWPGENGIMLHGENKIYILKNYELMTAELGRTTFSLKCCRI